MESDSIENICHLKQYLDDNGCIKSTDASTNIVEKMHTINSVAGRSLVINILRSTAIYSKRKVATKEALEMFLERGGWQKLGSWFSEMIDSKNLILLTQLVETLTLFPITIELLRASSIPKSLKNLSKFDRKPLNIASKRLLFIWKKYVKDVNEKKLRSADKPPNNAKQTTFLDSLAAAIETPEKQRKRKVPLLIEKSVSPEESPPRSTETVSQPDPNPQETTIPSINESQPNEIPNDSTLSKKRRVSFREEDSLVEVFEFEMTEQERMEMHGERPHLKFDEARQLESMEEKQALRNAKNYNLDEGCEWSRSVEIDNIICIRGENSNENQVQAQRESNILPPIFVDKSQMPISAIEPMPEDLEVSEEKKSQDTSKIDEAPVPCIPYWENYAYPPKIPHRPPPPFTIPQNIRRDAFKPRFPHNYDNSQRGGFRGRGRGKFFRGRGGMPLYPVNNFDGEFRSDDANYQQPDPNQPKPPLYNPPETFIKTVKCRHFLKGACLKGPACTFIHETPNLPR